MVARDDTPYDHYLNLTFRAASNKEAVAQTLRGPATGNMAEAGTPHPGAEGGRRSFQS
jgi:hypothetical protein